MPRNRSSNSESGYEDLSSLAGSVPPGSLLSQVHGVRDPGDELEMTASTAGVVPDGQYDAAAAWCVRGWEVRTTGLAAQMLGPSVNVCLAVLALQRSYTVAWVALLCSHRIEWNSG